MGVGREWPLTQWVAKSDGTLYEPGDGQGLFHRSPAKYRALVGGRGSGKTTAGGQEALRRVREGKDGLVLSPNVPHFNTSTREEFWKWIPWDHVEHHHRSEKWLKFDTGSTVYYGGIEVEDRWRGPNVNWLWFDEAARKKDDKAWLVAVAGCRVGEEPAAWITTTPRGKKHWLYNLFVRQDVPREVQEILDEEGYDGPLYDYYHASIHDNQENLDPLYYASLLAGYTGKFKDQELLGLFVDTAEGLVYEEFGAENISADADYDEGRGPVELAYDDGFAVSPRVFLFIQRGDDGEIYVFDEIYHVKHLANVCIGEAKDLIKTYDEDAYIEIAVGDPSAAELKEAMRQADIPARGVKRDVIESIKRVRWLVLDGEGKRRLIVHPRCKNLIGEMSDGYRYPDGTNATGVIKPIKRDDHGPDAIAYYSALRTRPSYD